MTERDVKKYERRVKRTETSASNIAATMMESSSAELESSTGGFLPWYKMHYSVE
jgi:hypothetical protein